jgi:DNA ligase-like protein
VKLPGLHHIFADRAADLQAPAQAAWRRGRATADQRDNRPRLGSIITFRDQELSDRGVPRFPSFVGLRSDASPTSR